MTARGPAVAALAACLIVVACGVDLAGRSMARASWLAAVGLDLTTTGVVSIALAATALLLGALAVRGRLTRRARGDGRAGVRLSAGMAAQLSLGARLQSDGFYYFAYLRSIWFDGDQISPTTTACSASTTSLTFSCPRPQVTRRPRGPSGPA